MIHALVKMKETDCLLVRLLRVKREETRKPIAPSICNLLTPLPQYQLESGGDIQGDSISGGV
jgi:hypothetical protein